MRYRTLSCTIITLALSLFITACDNTPPHYTIGTGSKGATFYPLGNAICTLINQQNHGFTCEAVSTAGSTYNLDAIESGKHDLGLSQFNVQFQAYRGQQAFKRSHRQITTVAPLHQEIFILAVTKESGIQKFNDILGKKINIGNIGSGSRIITEQLFKQKGWRLSNLEIHEEKSSALPNLLCNQLIDGAIYSTGHPNKIYQQMIDTCDVKLIDIWDEDVKAFVADNWQYDPAVIPADTYEAIAEQKKGFGIRVVLSAHKSLPQAHIHALTKTIIENYHQLQQLAPIFRTINANIFPLANVAPYHAGAKRYYQGN